MRLESSPIRDARLRAALSAWTKEACLRPSSGADASLSIASRERAFERGRVELFGITGRVAASLSSFSRVAFLSPALGDAARFSSRMAA